MALAPQWLGVPLVACACVFLAPSWSFLQRFVEGRTHTEAIVALVSFSYIGVSGIVKSVGVKLLGYGLSERSMVVACVLFGVALGTASALVVVAQPPPSATDLRRRGPRQRITSLRAEGAMLFRRYGLGLSLSILAYVLCGTLRAYRDYFQLELFAAAEVEGVTSAFAMSEGTISVLVLSICALFSRVQSNSRAMHVIIAATVAGGALVAGLTLAWRAGRVCGFPWIVGVGCGTFLSYVPLGTMLFDRVLSAAEEHVTSTFLALVSDTCVLVGTAALLCYSQTQHLPSPSQPAHLRSPTPAAAEAKGHGQLFATLAVTLGTCIALLMSAAAFAFSRAIDERRRSAKIHRERSGAVAAADDPPPPESVVPFGVGLSQRGAQTVAQSDGADELRGAGRYQRSSTELRPRP